MTIKQQDFYQILGVNKALTENALSNEIKNMHAKLNEAGHSIQKSYKAIHQKYENENKNEFAKNELLDQAFQKNLAKFYKTGQLEVTDQQVFDYAIQRAILYKDGHFNVAGEMPYYTFEEIRKETEGFYKDHPPITQTYGFAKSYYEMIETAYSVLSIVNLRKQYDQVMEQAKKSGIFIEMNSTESLGLLALVQTDVISLIHRCFASQPTKAQIENLQKKLKALSYIIHDIQYGLKSFCYHYIKPLDDKRQALLKNNDTESLANAQKTKIFIMTVKKEINAQIKTWLLDSKTSPLPEDVERHHTQWNHTFVNCAYDTQLKELFKQFDKNSYDLETLYHKCLDRLNDKREDLLTRNDKVSLYKAKQLGIFITEVKKEIINHVRFYWLDKKDLPSEPAARKKYCNESRINLYQEIKEIGDNFSQKNTIGGHSNLIRSYIAVFLYGLLTLATAGAALTISSVRHGLFHKTNTEVIFNKARKKVANQASTEKETNVSATTPR